MRGALAATFGWACLARDAGAGVRDEFDGPELDPAWAWDFPIPGATWSLTEVPGHLSLHIPQTSPTGQDYDHWPGFDRMPKLRRTDFTPGDFELRTRVQFTADPAHQYHLGLLIQFEAPETDVLMFGLYDIYDEGIELVAERTGRNWLFGRPPIGTNSAELRVVALDTTYFLHWRRSDADEWTFYGSLRYPRDRVTHVGLFAKNWARGAELDVQFSHFELLPAREVKPPRAQWVATGPRCMALRVTTDVALTGGELALTYDPALATAFQVNPGADLPPAAVLQHSLSPQLACEGPDPLAGVTVGWIASPDGRALVPPGEHELIQICFARAAGAPEGACSPLALASCLGPPESPIGNLVVDDGGTSWSLAPLEGSVCPGDEPFTLRGDANADGRADISDPIAILRCLFLGSTCTRCLDGIDANDDGLVNIADASYILNWRFLGGPGIPAPFPDCGRDETPDRLPDCEGATACP